MESDLKHQSFKCAFRVCLCGAACPPAEPSSYTLVTVHLLRIMDVCILNRASRWPGTATIKAKHVFYKLLSERNIHGLLLFMMPKNQH